MNILFLSHYATLFGANRSLLALIDGLMSYGVRSQVLLPQPGPLSRELSLRGVRWHVASLPTWIFPIPHDFGNPWANRLRTMNRRARNLMLLANSYRRFRWDAPPFGPVDIVYSNSVVTGWGIYLSRTLRCPHVWHLREFASRDYSMAFTLGDGLTRRLLRGASARICVSRAIREHFFPAGAPASTHVIPNGVAFERRMDQISPKNLERKSRDRFEFLLLGLVAPLKGHEAAVWAMHRLRKTHPHAHLKIVGGAAYPELKSLVHQLELEDRICFSDFVEDPFTALFDANALLMTSRCEAFGRVTAEAMAAGLPVIGNRTGGTPEVIVEHRTGLLYDGSADDLALNMARLMDEPRLAESLGRQGQARAKERFTIEHYAKQIYEVLQPLVPSPLKAPPRALTGSS